MLRRFGVDISSDAVPNGELPAKIFGHSEFGPFFGALQMESSNAGINHPAAPADINGTDGNDFIHEAGDGNTPPDGTYNEITTATEHADNLYGNGGDDIIYGDGGNDFISGGDGNDQLWGGSGSDTIEGGAGNNTLDGGDGNDTLTYSFTFQYDPAATFHMTGDAGNDVLMVAQPNGNVLDGGSGQDLVALTGTSGLPGATFNLATQTLSNAHGTDQLVSIEGAAGSWGDDTLIGNADKNWLSGGGGNDVLEGGGGDDILSGRGLVGIWTQGGLDPLFLGDGTDTAVYSHAPSGETIEIGESDIAFGGDGMDKVYQIENIVGSNFNDYIVGSTNWSNNNKFIGGAGNDTLIGGSGATLPDGVTFGQKYLDGGSGDDVLVGGVGPDKLVGGTGADIMTGGGGRDTFIFHSLSALSLNADHITDFEFDLDRLDFSGISGLTFIGAAPFSDVAGQMNYVFSDGKTIVQIDANGDGTADHLLVIDNGEFQLGETTPGSRILTSVDNTVPTLLSATPNSGDVAPGAPQFALTFSEAVQAGHGKFEIHSEDGAIVETISVANNYGRIHFSGDSVLIDPAVTLDASTQYYVTIDDGAFTNLAGTPYAGLTAADNFDFTTSSDVTPPQFVSWTPGHNATDVPVNGNIVLTYDGTVKAGTGHFDIYMDEGGVETLFTSIAASDTSQVTFSGDTVTINPSLDLFGNTHFFVTADDYAVTDSAGNFALRIDAGSNLEFLTAYTADTTAPTLLSVTPSNGAAGVDPSSNIVMTFSEPVRAGLVPHPAGDQYVTDFFSIYRSDGTLIKFISATDTSQVTFSGNTVTINPNFDLPPGTNIYVVVGSGAVEDPSGNFYAGIASPSGLAFTTKWQFTGTDSADILQGTIHNDTINALGGNDVIDLTAGGNDTVSGGDGNDTFRFDQNFTAADRLDGGAGHDSVSLNGDYSAGVMFSAATMINVETINIAAGHSYKLISNDATVAAGQMLVVNGSALGAGDVLIFNGAHETDGRFNLEGGAGADRLTGGAGNDVITGGLGADSLAGGGGADHFVYATASQSTSVNYDTISAFDYSADKLDLASAVTGIDAAVASGTLSAASFDGDLASALSAHLMAHHAVLFTPSAGTLHGQTFLVVDLNGTAGYQAGQDLVIHMAGATGTLTAADFI